MKQLEKRLYEREELAEVLNLNLKSSHFARDAKNILTNWGYDYEYSRKGANITRAPESAEERITEMMIRIFDIDIRSDIFAFACFINLLATYYEFTMMPWDERAKEIKDIYEVVISADALKKWYRKLVNKGFVDKSRSEKTYWRTCYVNGMKIREVVDDDKSIQEMREYWQHGKEVRESFIANAISSGRKDYKQINTESWKYCNEALWRNYQWCYYSCARIDLNILGECAQELYELINEISEGGYKEYEIVVNTSIVPIENKN